LRVAEAERAREMETLRRLEAKYRVPANRTDDAGAITAGLAVVEPVSPVIERTPVQASLF
jgi:hypothetical protein